MRLARGQQGPQAQEAPLENKGVWDVKSRESRLTASRGRVKGLLGRAGVSEGWRPMQLAFPDPVGASRSYRGASLQAAWPGSLGSVGRPGLALEGPLGVLCQKSYLEAKKSRVGCSCIKWVDECWKD